MADQIETKPALWVWIAVIPAMIGGHFGAMSGRKGFPIVTAGLAWVSMVAFYLGCVAFHVYTIILAHEIIGFGAALVTAATAPIAELYWFFRVWHMAGYIANLYDTLFLVLAGLLMFGIVMAGIAVYLQERASGATATSR